MEQKPYIDPDREDALEVRKRVARAMSSALLILGRSVAAQVAKAWREHLGKADGDEESFLKDLWDALIIEFDDDLDDDLVDALGHVHSSSGNLALAQVGATTSEGLVDQVNLAAIEWAEQHVGEMIGRNPGSASWISDATRNMIRSTIVRGLEENVGSTEIAARIEAEYAFSDDRAQLIALTEIASANSMGALNGYEEAKAQGVRVGKSWLILEDACPSCHANANQGVIHLEEAFQSGDLAPPAHPNCRCVIVPETDFAKVTKWDASKHPRDPGGEDGGQFVALGPDATPFFDSMTDKENAEWERKNKPDTSHNELHDLDPWSAVVRPAMSDDEFEAALDYWDEGHKINAKLRKGKTPGSVAALDAAIHKGITNKDMVAYRGISEERALAVLERGGYSDAGYVSTVGKIDTGIHYSMEANDNPTKAVYVLSVHTPKGSHALPMADVTADSDREVVLPRGSSFKVTRTSSTRHVTAENSAIDVTVIHVDHTDPNAKMTKWDEASHPRDPGGEGGGQFVARMYRGGNPEGEYYAFDRETAEAYAEDYGGAFNGVVTEKEIALKNPLMLDTPKAVKEAWDESNALKDGDGFHGTDKSSQALLNRWAKFKGHDGIVVPASAFEGEDGYEWAAGTFGEPQVVVFHPDIAAVATPGTGPVSKAAWSESDHPRDEDGKFTSSLGAAGDTLRTELEMYDKLGHVHPGKKALLENGQEFGPAIKLPGVEMGPQKMCYMNSYQALLHGTVDKSEWFYTEGVTNFPGLPLTIDHAWLTNRKGEVLDLTLRNPEGHEYYGVPFKWDYVTKRTAKTGHYGLFSNGVHWYPDVAGQMDKHRAYPKDAMKKWDESKHPRDPGGEGGGQFVAHDALNEKERDFRDVIGESYTFVRDDEDIWDKVDNGPQVKEAHGALARYAEMEYEKINGRLRRGDYGNHGDVADNDIGLIDRALHGSLAEKDFTTFRGVSSNRAERILEEGEFKDAGFLSTTGRVSTALGFSEQHNAVGYSTDDHGHYILAINVKEGSRALAMNNGMGVSKEKEILLPRGGTYRVTGKTSAAYVDDDFDGTTMTVIHVDYIDPTP